MAVYVAALFTPALIDDADATHANAAQHMARSGDWVTLYVNGIRYLEKPPLPYWLAALDYHVFGYNAFATHLPLILAVLGNAILGWVWARRAFNERAAFYTALGLFTTVGVFLFTRTFIPESILCFFLALALWSFLTALEDRKPNRFYITYASIAVALLAKGLIAPVFFGAAVVPYLLITGDWRRWREFRLPTGILLFLAIGAPWHVMAALRNPDHGHPIGNVPNAHDEHGFLYFYFVNEHVLRFLGKRYPHDYNKQPGWVFWVGHLAWLFPWCLFFPAAVARLWARRGEFRDALFPDRANTITFLDRHETAFHAAFAVRQERFRARTTLLLGIYAGFILLFFSLSTNQEYYTWPSYFALLLLVSGSLSLQEMAPGPRRERWLLAAHWLLAVVGTLCSVALLAALWSSRHLPYVPDVGTLLAHRGVGDYSLAMSHFFDLTGPSFAALRLPALLAAVTLLVGPSLALWLRRRGHGFEATTSVGLTMALFLVAAHIGYVRFEPLLGSKAMADLINATAQPEAQLVIYGDQASASSVIFYTHRQALLVNGRSSSMIWGSFYPDAPHIFLEDADLVSLWTQASAANRQIFLVVPPEFDAHVRSLLGAQRLVDIKEVSDRTLYTNCRSLP
ncbi:glycosyltransferase family 39 protein [Acidipila sp. EB88]|nr:glycosyltransferase family 39 protein [Acidipila sp. EB88]